MTQLLDERDLGVLTSAMSLLVALVSNNHDAYWSCVPKCVKILERLARNQDVPQEYTYYGIPSPWLQVCLPLFLIQQPLSLLKLWLIQAEFIEAYPKKNATVSHICLSWFM